MFFCSNFGMLKNQIRAKRDQKENKIGTKKELKWDKPHFGKCLFFILKFCYVKYLRVKNGTELTFCMLIRTN